MGEYLEEQGAVMHSFGGAYLIQSGFFGVWWGGIRDYGKDL